MPTSLVAPLALIAMLAAALPAEAQNLSLRLYGHGAGDIDRVKVPIDPQVPADVAGSFTLEFWMKAAAADNTSGACAEGGDNWITGNIIFDRDIFGPGDFGDYGVSIHGGTVAFGTSVGGSNAGLCGDVPVTDSNWHHVAVTRNGGTGTIALFVDGVLDRSISGPSGDLSYNDGRATAFPASDPYLVIGAEKHDAGAAFPSYAGLVDEVRLSNVVRYTVDFAPLSDPFTPDANTVALYHFDEGPVGACTGAVLDASGAAGGPSDGTCSFGGSAPAGPEYVADNPFTGLIPSVDAVVEPPKALRVTVSAGSAPLVRKLKVKVRRADEPIGGGTATIELTASDGDCPAGTVTGAPVAFELAPRKKGNATIQVAIDPATFNSLNSETPTRCTLGLSASATGPGNIDPSPSNGSVGVEINVYDLGDAPVVTAHESFVAAVKHVKLKLKAGATSLSKTVRFRFVNGDVEPSDEVPGHEIAVAASDGDCPPGTVASVDADRKTEDIQSSVLVAGGDKADGELGLVIDAAAFTSGGKHAPARCTAEISVSGPGGDVDATNDVARVVIDVFDGNDF